MRAANANQWSIVEWKIKPSDPRWILPQMRPLPAPQTVRLEDSMAHRR